MAAYLPNIPETVAAFLATASLGAVWSSAAPEFGARSVIDRFSQIEPKVLLAIDGYRYGGKDFDRSDVVKDIAEEIGDVPVVEFGYLKESGWPHAEPAELEFAQLPFDHPLWVLYSSGTTGLPKSIVQGQGGILLEHLKKMHLHLDAQEGDRVFWFSTTGWMMWNFLVGVLLTPASIVLYDGNPAGEVLWDLAADTGITTFGTSASFIAASMKEEIEPADGRDLSALDAVGSTGSPLSPEGFSWVYDKLGEDTWLFSTSGGTDVCTAFVGGVPVLPVYRGELQGRALGAKVEAWDEDGNSLTGEVGELVITEPMPSMPVFFWGDEDGSRLRRATSTCTRASGATATGSRSPSAARRSSTAAPTRPSTAAECAWAPARSTARCWRWTTSPTRWWSTSRARARRTTCRCSWCCARAPSSTTT